MKRKVISSLLALSMAVGLVAGCTTVASAEEGGTTTTSYGEYTEENPYHLVFSYVEFYEQDDAARQAVQDALNDYMIPTYHIEVEFLPLQFSDYQTNVQLMLSGGDALDVMPIYYTYAASWINMGGIYDMSELMETEDGQKIVEALGEDNAYVGQMNGVLYGFPANKESVELGGLCMRADICDELGLTEEYNLAENDGTFTEAYDWSVAGEIFAKVQEAHPDMIPLYMYNADQLNRFADFDYLVDYFGGLDLQADRESTQIVNIFETDTFKTAVSTLADWYDKGYIYKDAATDTQGTATMMKAGNTFSYATAIKPGFLAEAEAANGCKCYVMFFKTGGGTDGYITTTNVSFYNTGIANNSEDPEMAFKFISALYSDPTVMNIWQYGIEGVNYQIQDDGTIYYVDGEDDGNFAYHQNTGWFMGNQFNSYVWNDGSKSADYWEKLAAHNDNAYYSPVFGFMWDSSAYATQITALNNAWTTYRANLLTGSCGTANVDSTIQALNDALYASGLEDVMTAKQAQLDEWLANNQ
ncbi:MAG: ABC transporter substrate-binding protein [Eubacteriales bacterium]|nr:ABC transporter substrate-binding protein [Eubacteriales bacterium]